MKFRCKVLVQTQAPSPKGSIINAFQDANNGDFSFQCEEYFSEEEITSTREEVKAELPQLGNAITSMVILDGPPRSTNPLGIFLGSLLVILTSLVGILSYFVIRR